jgi:hypothetical protein
MNLTLKLLSCVAIAALWLYEAVRNQNELTKLRLEIPVLAKEVEKVREGNVKLSFEIEKFESPAHLMELSRLPQYRHLTYPYDKDVLVIDAKKHESTALKKDSR